MAKIVNPYMYSSMSYNNGTIYNNSSQTDLEGIVAHTSNGGRIEAPKGFLVVEYDVYQDYDYLSGTIHTKQQQVRAYINLVHHPDTKNLFTFFKKDTDKESLF